MVRNLNELKKFEESRALVKHIQKCVCFFEKYYQLDIFTFKSLVLAKTSGNPSIRRERVVKIPEL